MTQLNERSTLSIALAVVLAGWIGSSVWWAAVISTKLDTLIGSEQRGNEARAAQNVRIESLERDVAVLKSGGRSGS